MSAAMYGGWVERVQQKSEPLGHVFLSSYPILVVHGHVNQSGHDNQGFSSLRNGDLGHCTKAIRLQKGYLRVKKSQKIMNISFVLEFSICFAASGTLFIPIILSL